MDYKDIYMNLVLLKLEIIMIKFLLKKLEQILKEFMNQKEN
jgi:hypothetical protein